MPPSTANVVAVVKLLWSDAKCSTDRATSRASAWRPNGISPLKNAVPLVFNTSPRLCSE